MKVSDKPENIQDRISRRGKVDGKLTCLSFFSGAMGLDIGLEKAGINVVLACEIDKPMRRTIIANDNEIGLIGDIRDYSVEQVLSHSGLSSADDVDLIVGGPPCQAFSTAGKRMGFSDQRGNVFLKFIDLIKDIQPKYAVIENVRGLYSSAISIDLDDDITRTFDFDTKDVQGSSLYYIKRRLESAGYKVTFNLYNSANYGVPQVRERIVITCSRDGMPIPYLAPTHSSEEAYGLPPWRTFRQAIENLPNSEPEYVKFSEKRLKYFRMLKEGQYWKDLPDDVRQEAMGNSYHLGGGKTGFFRKLAWDKPSPTVVTHPAMPATELSHPTEERPLSVQEYKRIQQFPDEWEICGSTIERYKQIGNAIPIGLGEAIGRAIIEHHNGRVNRPIENFSYSRYRKTSDTEFEQDFIKRAQAQTSLAAVEQTVLDLE